MGASRTVTGWVKKIGRYGADKQRTCSTLAVSRAHGVFNILGGAWPLLGLRSFEKIFGPKPERWLVYTVASLLVTSGGTLLTTPGTPDGLRQARRLGAGTALSLLVIDLTHAPTGRISRAFLLDAVAEAFWLLAWIRSTEND